MTPPPPNDDGITYGSPRTCMRACHGASKEISIAIEGSSFPFPPLLLHEMDVPIISSSLGREDELLYAHLGKFSPKNGVIRAIGI